MPKYKGELDVQRMTIEALWRVLHAELSVLESQCVFGGDPTGRQARCRRCRLIVVEIRIRGDQLGFPF